MAHTPLGKPRVHWTLLAVAGIAIVAMVFRVGLSAAQHTEIRDEEKTWLRIDINRAEAKELALLPGVGPVLARRIVDNRDRLGKFGTVKDLLRVHGIGPKKLAAIDEICEAGPSIGEAPDSEK